MEETIAPEQEDPFAVAVWLAAAVLIDQARTTGDLVVASTAPAGADKEAPAGVTGLGLVQEGLARLFKVEA
jgi:hypothetical protein